MALVQSYLHVNGYFTVVEYPVLEARRGGTPRTITDLDVLAFRVSTRAGGGFLRSCLRGRRDVLRHAQLRDSGLAMLALLEKWNADGESL